MAIPYVGEIRMFAGNFAPAGWMFCSGQILPISEYETLFNLIGTTYGGDGQETFALPNLQGRVPIHQGGGFFLAEMGGVEQVTLTTNQIPAHSHAALANGSGTAPKKSTPTNAVWGSSGASLYVTDPVTLQAMRAGSVVPTGGSQPHDNMQPFLGISFIISLYGIFPSPT